VHPDALAPYTTLRLGGPATRLLTARSDAELINAVRGADRRGEPVLLIGGGSNLVIADDGFPGTAVRITTQGLTLQGRDLELAAGENWTDAVAATVRAGLAGVECLAGIPGSAGATPIQNVGAYGQEVSSTITEVVAYDRAAGDVVTLPARECAFSYRSSRFKEDPERHVVLRVRFRLGEAAGMSEPIRYAETARALGVETGERVPLEKASATVLALRAGKGMVLDPDDHDTWSAGSFFTNPILDAAAVPDGAPAFPQPDGRVKTSAAWLIDHAGFAKGYRQAESNIGISTKHVLALTNRGGGTTTQLQQLKDEIVAKVEQTYGITLVPEPVLVRT
jgi:UDP-N-acetylmuramate dehydrogenase